MDSRAPVSQTPLSQQGKSLQAGLLTAKGGLATNVASLERRPDQCRVLNNLHMFVRGVWTSRGIGWTRHRAGSFNLAAGFLEFGKYTDNAGLQTLLFQVGSKLYSYNTATATETELQTGLSTTALPCMRGFYSPVSGKAITIYCNGLIQPLKITSPTVATSLSWTDGLNVETATIGGTVSIGSVATVTFNSPSFLNNLVSVSYTVIAGDTLNKVAAGLAAAINANSTLIAANIDAISTGPVVTITYPESLSITFSTGVNIETATIGGAVAAGNATTVTAAVPATATETATIGGSTTLGNTATIQLTSVSIPTTGQESLTYTYGAAETTTTVATALTALINANPRLAAAGITASSAAAVITISYPAAISVSFAQSTSGGATVVLAVGVGTGGSASATYTAVAADTTTTVAAGLAAAINSNYAMAAAGIVATSNAAIVTITSPTALGSITWSRTVTGFTNTLAAGTSTNTATVTLAAASSSTAWPAQFNGKSYNTPKFCEIFGDRAVFSGFPDPTTAFDVLITKAGNPESFETNAPQQVTDAGSFTYPPELGPLKSVRVHQLNNQNNDQIVILGCLNGIAIIDGGDASNFALHVLTDQFGIPSNRCFIRFGNELIFLSTCGVKTFSSLLANAVMASNSLSFIIQDLVNQIDQDNWEKAHAVHHPSTQEIWFWLPMTGDGGICKHALVLNYNNDASATGNITPIWSTRDGTSVACSFAFKGVQYGGGYDGLLQVWYSGKLYDTTPIIFQMTSALISIGNPSQASSMRNITVVTDGGDQNCQIRANVYERVSGGGFRKVAARPPQETLTGSVVAQTALGSWQLGLSAFPSEHIKPLDFQPSGHGQFWEVELISTSAADALDYYGLAYTLSGGGIERS
jgi:hypothetical protein